MWIYVVLPKRGCFRFSLFFFRKSKRLTIAVYTGVFVISRLFYILQDTPWIINKLPGGAKHDFFSMFKCMLAKHVIFRSKILFIFEFLMIPHFFTAPKCMAIPTPGLYSTINYILVKKFSD